MNRPILTVMADYGSGPYLWLVPDETCDNAGVGECVGSYNYLQTNDLLAPITNDLQSEFDNWITEFERHSDYAQFRWDLFHKKGLHLAQRLKKQLGEKATVRYMKPCEDPNQQDAITKIEVADLEPGLAS